MTAPRGSPGLPPVRPPCPRRTCTTCSPSPGSEPESGQACRAPGRGRPRPDPGASGVSLCDLLRTIVAMAAAVATAAELGRRLGGPLTGTLTGLFLVILPNTSRYAAGA